MTPAALTQARLDQAAAARERAERTLARIMRRLDRRYDPVLHPVAEAVLTRRWESRLEHPSCDRALLDAYGRYRRCQRAEGKARSAAHRARFDVQPAAGASIAQAALTSAEVLAGLRERRAA